MHAALRSCVESGLLPKEVVPVACTAELHGTVPHYELLYAQGFCVIFCCMSHTCDRYDVQQTAVNTRVQVLNTALGRLYNVHLVSVASESIGDKLSTIIYYNTHRVDESCASLVHGLSELCGGCSYWLNDYCDFGGTCSRQV